MKSNFLLAAYAALALGISAPSIAGTIGSVTWDGTSQFITSTETTTTWVQFGLSSGYSYAQALAATNAGGAFSGYHVASREELASFLNYMIPNSDPFSTTQSYDYFLSSFNDGVFGDNNAGLNDAFFATDDGFNFALGQISGPAGNIRMEPLIYNLTQVDTFTKVNNLGFLYVSDSSATTTAVPEPSTTAMLGIGLLGLFGYSRRKLKHF